MGIGVAKVNAMNTLVVLVNGMEIIYMFTKKKAMDMRVLKVDGIGKCVAKVSAINIHLAWADPEGDF